MFLLKQRKYDLYSIDKNLFCWIRGKCNRSKSTPSFVVIVAKYYFVSKTVSRIVGVGRSTKSSILLVKLLAKTDLVSKILSK